jgi:hypothetical protein
VSETVNETVSETTRDWKLAFIVRLGTLLLRALASTWRFRITNDAGF